MVRYSWYSAVAGYKNTQLTVFEDEDKIFIAIKAGANGYMLKKRFTTKDH